jgi:predicted nucleic acid-binding protein
VDTWGWLALGHRRDLHHGTVKQLYKDLRDGQTPIYTSDYVLDETITLLFRREPFQEATRFMEGVIAAAAKGHVSIERVTSQRFLAAWELRTKFQDKPMISFTDLTSMAIMEEHNIQQVLTEDDHFLQIGMGFIQVP